MCDKYHDAIHEAGHAVVLHYLGYKPISISLKDDFSNHIGGLTQIPKVSKNDLPLVCSGGVAATYLKQNSKIDVDSLSDNEVSNIWSAFGGSGGKDSDFYKVFSAYPNVEQIMRATLKILLQKKNWDKVLSLSEALMERNVLDEKEIDNILKE